VTLASLLLHSPISHLQLLLQQVTPETSQIVSLSENQNGSFGIIQD
jgi:hypothetical protein